MCSPVGSATDRIEQLTIQLAGCSAAAEGATKNPAIRGEWGWSPVYQDVLELRLKYEALLKGTPEQRLVQAARDILNAAGVELSDESSACIILPMAGDNEMRVPVVFGE